jgi:hypothetical protein
MKFGKKTDYNHGDTLAIVDSVKHANDVEF